MTLIIAALVKTGAGRFGEKTENAEDARARRRGDPRAPLGLGALEGRSLYKTRRVGARTLVEEVDAWHPPCDALDRGAVERWRRPRRGREVERVAPLVPRGGHPAHVVRGDDEDDVLIGRGRRRGGGRRRGVLRGDEREERRRGREEQEKR